MLRHGWPADHAAVWQSRETAGEGGAPGWSLSDGAVALARNMAGVDTVLCLAGATPGPTSGPTSGSVADFALNARLAEAVVAAAAVAGGVRRVFLASSAAVYGAAPGPLTESGLCVPVSDYGRAKLEMEQRAAEVALARGVALCCLRIGNVVGADMLFGNVAAGRAITLDRFADGTTPRRSYIDPLRLGRVVRGLTDLARAGADLPPVLNVASEPALAMADLLEAAHVGYGTRPAPATAQPLVALDIARLGMLLPFMAGPCDAAAAVAAWRSVGGPQ